MDNESQEESEMLWLCPPDREKLIFKPNYAMLKMSSDESSSDVETQASSTPPARSTPTPPTLTPSTPIPSTSSGQTQEQAYGPVLVQNTQMIESDEEEGGRRKRKRLDPGRNLIRFLNSFVNTFKSEKNNVT